MLEFIEAPQFTRLLSEYLDDDEYAALQQYLTVRPEAGVVVPGSGGVRKLRWALPGKGKSSGLRVIYYLRLSQEQLWLLTLYAKGNTGNVPAHLLRKIKETIENESRD